MREQRYELVIHDAKATIQKFVDHAARLYEREKEEPGGPSLLRHSLTASVRAARKYSP